jgi:UDP-glucose 4-epimerase
MAAAGHIDTLDIFGIDYSTPDGTCIRDYIHVSNLADVRVKALLWIEDGNEALRINLGTGAGAKIRCAVSRRTGHRTPRSCPFRIAPRW